MFVHACLCISVCGELNDEINSKRWNSTLGYYSDKELYICLPGYRWRYRAQQRQVCSGTWFDPSAPDWFQGQPSHRWTWGTVGSLRRRKTASWWLKHNGRTNTMTNSLQCNCDDVIGSHCDDVFGCKGTATNLKVGGGVNELERWGSIQQRH